MEDEKAEKENFVEGTAPQEETTSANTEREETIQKESSNNRRFKKPKKDKTTERIEELESSLEQKNDQFLRLHAEFDNYRKRTLKEKMELTKSAGESLLVNILPVIDDFERAMKAMESATEIAPVKEGVDLIYKRFTDFIRMNGIKEIDAKEKEFDTDLHEAITKIPSPTEALKGKVVDVIQKGYTLNDKVIRFAKVVIGE
jgi:molecular chaperone GrpE